MFSLPESSNNVALRDKLAQRYKFVMTLSVNGNDMINVIMTKEQVLNVIDNCQYVEAGVDKKEKIVYVGKP